MADINPFFDLVNFKKLVKESLTSKNKILNDGSEESFTMALGLTAAIKKVFFEKSEHRFSSEPSIEQKVIIQFINRMRIDAMEKFNAPTLMSAVHYYKDATAMSKDDPVGLIIVYIERIFVPEMLRLLKYPYVDYDNDDEVLDGIGAISNLIAGYFKTELGRLGYVDLEMSHFRSAINTVSDGVEYCKNQKNKYEIAFEIDGERRMVVDMIMDPLLKIAKER